MQGGMIVKPIAEFVERLDQERCIFHSLRKFGEWDHQQRTLFISSGQSGLATVNLNSFSGVRVAFGHCREKKGIDA